MALKVIRFLTLNQILFTFQGMSSFMSTFFPLLLLIILPILILIPLCFLIVFLMHLILLILLLFLPLLLICLIQVWFLPNLIQLLIPLHLYLMCQQNQFWILLILSLPPLIQFPLPPLTLCLFLPFLLYLC